MPKKKIGQKNAKFPIQVRSFCRSVIARLGCLTGLLIVSTLKLQASFCVLLLQTRPAMAIAGRIPNASEQQKRDAYGPTPPLPVDEPPLAVPWPEEHIWTMNIVSVRECL